MDNFEGYSYIWAPPNFHLLLKLESLKSQFFWPIWVLYSKSSAHLPKPVPWNSPETPDMCLNYVHHFARVFLRHCLVNWLQLMHFFLNCKCCTHLPKVSCIIITPSKSYTNRSRIYADYLRRCTRYFGGNEHFAISIVRQTKWKTIIPSLLFVARCVFLVIRISNRLESQCFCAASHSSNLLVFRFFPTHDIDRCSWV